MQEQHLMAAYYPNNVTTDHIQQYLDENKSLILKIVECQNSGKINECAENQARLQRNLMYLAAIADSQPQPTAMHQQLASPSGMMQTGAHYTQQQQHAAQQMTPQSLMAVRSSMLYSQQPFAALQQHQAALHGHLGTSSAGLHMLQSGEGSKQDIGNAGSGEGRGGSSGGQSGETHYLKSADDVN